MNSSLGGDGDGTQHNIILSNTGESCSNPGTFITLNVLHNDDVRCRRDDGSVNRFELASLHCEGGGPW